MNNAKFVYGKEWNEKLRKMSQPISEDEARSRFVNGPRFSVAKLPYEDAGVPFYSMEIEPNLSAVNVIFYDEFGSISKLHGFRRIGGQLFQDSSVSYVYADRNRLNRMNDAIILKTVDYDPAGVGRITTDDKSQPTIERVSYDNVDISDNWEAIPEFGNWDSLGRRDRSSP